MVNIMKRFSRETLVSALLFRGISAGSCATQSGVDITVYGSASTPGKEVYPYFLCNGQTLVPGSMGMNQNTVLSAGDGSYSNPAVLASSVDNPNLPPCTIVYIPYIQKYVQFADKCASCTSDFQSGKWHVDLWIGPNPADYQASQVAEMTKCEDNWGSSTHDIILNPESSYKVQSLPLDDGTTCYSLLDTTIRAFPDSSFSGTCSGNGGPAPAQSSAGPAVASSSANTLPTGTLIAPVVTPPAPSQTTTSVVQPPIVAPTGGWGPPQVEKLKANVQTNATTLLTVASDPVTANEPTGTPLATTNGVCTTAGTTVCSVDGTQIGICKSDLTVVFMDVAAGTKCKDGFQTFADA